MHFKQFYLSCLAHASYLIGDGDACVIIDPQRDVDQYIEEAKARGLVIRHIVETHLHADFVSGHVELARRTGATVHIGRQAKVRYPHVPVAEGDEIQVGGTRLKFLETPGHTPESICVLVFDAPGDEQPSRVLTGDTLFIGDVGRPDLVGSKGYSSEDMAGMMFESLHGKLLPLPDSVQVFPSHGAGSACGKNISSALSCTIGQQRLTNYALQSMEQSEFVELMTKGLAAPPPYFPHSAEMNRQGARPLSELPPLKQLEVSDVTASLAAGALVLDVRDAQDFGAAHLPGAVNIGLGGQFASWVGQLIPVDTPLVLMAKDDAAADEAVLRLARVGFEDVAGMVRGGIKGWMEGGGESTCLPQLTVDALQHQLPDELLVLDVRRPGEFDGPHVPGALNVPVERLAERLGELDPTAKIAVICQTGYRSSAASSLLERAGFQSLSNVVGGTVAWIDAGLSTVSGT